MLDDVRLGLRCASMAWIAAAQAADCPRQDALGTSRVLAVDAATTPRVGIEELSADAAA